MLHAKKVVSWLVIVLFFACISAVSANHSTLRVDPFNTLPDSNLATFRTQGRTFWGHEASQLGGEHDGPFVFSGGLHGTSVNLTSAAFATVAHVPERVSQTATAITYAAVATDTCWTIISSDNNGITGWTRVGTTAYYFLCEGDGTPNQPVLPPNSTWLMRSDITGSAITGVLDLRILTPTQAVTRAVYVPSYATGGDGTGARPWTGWETTIDWVTANRLIYFPPGYYTQASNIVVSGHRIEVRGAGKHRTFITYTTTGTAWRFQLATAEPIVQNAWGHLALTPTDVAATKIGLDLVDVSEFHAEEFCIGCASNWTGATSVGLRVRGREVSSIRRAEIKGDNVIQISDNPNSTIDIDNFHFEDLYLSTTSTTSGSCVLIDTGINLTNVTFDGYQAWTRCTNGLRWIDTTTVSASVQLSLSNIRHEQGTGAGGYCIDIQHNSSLQGLTVRNSYCGVLNGVRLRNVRIGAAILEDYLYATTNTCLDIDNTVYPVILLGSFCQAGSTITVQDNRTTFSTGRNLSDGLLPGSAVTIYDRPNSFTGESWTPTIAGTTVAGSHTYLTQVGRAVRVGQVMLVSGYVQINVKDAAMAGNAVVRVLPIANVNIASLACAASFSTVNLLAHAAGFNQFVGNIAASGTDLQLAEVGSNLTQTAVPSSAVVNSTAIGFSATCFINS